MGDPDSAPACSAGIRPRFDKRFIAHAVFFLIGASALVLLVRTAGTGALLSMLRASARWLPVLVALEIARIGFETLTTYLLSGAVRRGVRPLALLRVHVVGYAIASVMPAGRAAS